jgi:hypothetical protein
MMKLSDEERAALHEQLDELLDMRDKLYQEHDIKEASTITGLLSLGNFDGHPAPTELAQPALALLTKSQAFIAEVLSNPIVDAALHPPLKSRYLLSHWMFALQPILDGPKGIALENAPHEHLHFYNVIKALSALDAGQVEDIFKPANRNNSRLNQYDLSWAKYEGLVMREELILWGQKAGEANLLVSRAFGENWETIRKWEKPLHQYLNSLIVGSIKIEAKKSYDKGNTPHGLIGGGLTGYYAAWQKRLKIAGEKYRLELKKAAELSPMNNSRKNSRSR